MKESQYRLHGGGRKLTDIELEKPVLSWVHEQRANMLRVSRKVIMLKAKSIYDKKCENNDAMKDAFIDNNVWLVKFMSRNILSLRRKKKIAQKDPSILLVGL